MNYVQIKNQIKKYFPKDEERAIFDLDFAIVQAEEELVGVGKSQIEIHTFTLNGVDEFNILRDTNHIPLKIGQIKEVVVTKDGKQLNTAEIELDEYMRYNPFIVTGETLKYVDRLPYAVQEKDGNKYIVIHPDTTLAGAECKVLFTSVNIQLKDSATPKMPIQFHKYIIYGAVSELAGMLSSRVDVSKFIDANIFAVYLRNIQNIATINRSKFLEGKKELEVYIATHRSEPPVSSASVLFDDPSEYIQGRG